MCIEMGNDGKYHVSGEGTIVFQREHGAPLTMIDVKYVPGLKKNLVSVAMLEEKGYDVVFSKGKAFLRHIGMGQTKRIRIQVKDLYKMEVDDCAAHRHNKHKICLPSVLQASYFLLLFLLDPLATIYVNSSLTQLTKLKNHCAILKE